MARHSLALLLPDPAANELVSLSTDTIRHSLICLLYVIRRRLAYLALSSASSPLTTRPEPVAARAYLEAHPFHPRYYHIDCWDAMAATLSDLKSSKAAQADRIRMRYHRRVR